MCTDNVAGLDQKSHCVIGELHGQAELPRSNAQDTTGSDDDDVEMVVVATTVIPCLKISREMRHLCAHCRMLLVTSLFSTLTGTFAADNTYASRQRTRKDNQEWRL